MPRRALQLGLRTPHRRGFMYVAILGVSMIIMVIGLGALTVVRIERRDSGLMDDFAQARFHAQSAIEMGLLRIAQDPNWRNTCKNGIWEADQPIGSGTYTLEGLDVIDGDLADFEGDGLTLRGMGAQGEARYKLAVDLTALRAPLTCLQAALHAGNDVVFQDPCVASGTGVISANDTIQALGAVTVNPDMESMNGFVGALGPGQTTSPIPPRTMPDPTTVYDFYIANGTPISVPGMRFDKVVLSPASNPFGPTNAQGIYVVDCLGQDFTITKSRIVGTLVLLNPGANSEVKPSVNWEPAVSNYPALLVDGTFRLDIGATALDEASNINFNPSGTPYQGSEDSDLLDTYPAIIKGLIYVRNDLVTANTVTVDGVIVVGNTVTASGALNLTYQQAYLDNPPTGFSEPPVMVIATGSWQRVVE